MFAITMPWVSGAGAVCAWATIGASAKRAYAAAFQDNNLSVNLMGNTPGSVATPITSPGDRKAADPGVLPMRFTLRLLSWNAAAYALLALAPIVAHAQTAPAPETHGIVIANMDRSVKPGDDWGE